VPEEDPHEPAGLCAAAARQSDKTTATTMYREMEMQFWLEQAEVEMGGLV
jgi:hypothetical protein